MNQTENDTTSPITYTTTNPELSVQAESAKLGGIEFGCKKIKRALTFSVLDGIFASAMIALTETFSVAGAVFLNASAIAIAILGSLPLFLSSIIQLFLPILIDSSCGRKHYVIRGALFQSLFLALLAFCGWFPEYIRSWSYVFIFALYGFSGNVVAGLWIAWMGDLVPRTIRGRHFAWRNRLFSITQLLCALVAGFFLRKYTTHNAPWLLFAIVFLIAAFFRIISTRLLFSQCEPVVSPANGTMSLKNLFAIKPFFRYSLATAMVQGTVAIAGPFFNVFYIRDLKFDFFALSAATAATVLGTIVSLSFWGKLSDTVGNRTVLWITGFLITTVPLPYVVVSLPWHVWVLNFYTGFCWSGYNLSNFNYLLLASGTDRPEMSISFSVALTGISVFFFSIVGGLLSTHLPVLFAWQIQSLFLLSAILRFAVFCTLFPRFHNYEPERGKSLDLFFQVAGYRGGLGLLRNTFRAFRIK